MPAGFSAPVLQWLYKRSFYEGPESAKRLQMTNAHSIPRSRFFATAIFTLVSLLISTGHAYQGCGNQGVPGVPSTGRSTAVVKIRLKQAARDAAERILDALHISVRPPGPFGYKDN
jgi:hypothetical protein